MPPTGTTKKSVRKAGRTLLVNSLKNDIDEKFAADLKGLENQVITKSSKSVFLTFDTVDNAVAAFRKLKANSNDLKVKFSYYRVFFKLSGLTDDTDYNTIKATLTTTVENESGASVLYCKFYRKDNKFIGSGDLTLDTMSGMNKLTINKEGLTFSGHTGHFYRYNNKKSDDKESDN